jgi:hypothetical protein
MAGVTKVNGKYHTEELVHRDLFFKVVGIDGGAAMAQADLDRIMQNVHLTSTIEVIGTFEDGVSTSVNIVISGADVTALEGTDTIADIAGF